MRKSKNLKSGTNRIYCIGIWTFHSSTLSFLAAKSPQMELSFPGTFAHVECKVQELSLHGTFVPVELSLFRSECQRTFAPWYFRFLELSLSYLKKLGKALQQSVRRHILAMVSPSTRDDGQTGMLTVHDGEQSGVSTVSCMPPLRAESFKAAAELSAVGLPSSRCGEVCDNELCRPVSDIQGCRHLRSATLGLLDKPRYELETYGRRAFSYVCLELSPGPSSFTKCDN